MPTIPSVRRQVPNKLVLLFVVDGDELHPKELAQQLKNSTKLSWSLFRKHKLFDCESYVEVVISSKDLKIQVFNLNKMRQARRIFMLKTFDSF